MDPLALLERPDKWFLGGGRTLIYAPPFPQYLHTPGLWDEAHLLDFAHPRPFTWTLLDEHNKEIPLRWESHSWRPDRMTRTWSTTRGLTLVERSCCLRDDILAAEITVMNETDAAHPLTIVLWTIHERGSDHDESDTIRPVSHGIVFDTTQIPVRRGQRLSPVRCRVLLFADREATSRSIASSQRNAYQPHWRLTPFAEATQAGRIAGKESTVAQTDIRYLASTFSFVAPAHDGATVTVGTAFRVGGRGSWPSLTGAIPRADKQWRRWFDSVPSFECSDPYLTHAYWYRWYGLRLNAIEPPADGPWNYRHPAVCEGIQYFRDLIPYSAQVHMRELRWMHDPTFAQGSLRNFLDHQKPDGNFPGNIYATFVHNDDMYHADWGRSLLDLHAIHPDGAFLEEAYAPLCRYARFFLTERDPSGTHLFDVVDQ